MDPKELKYVVGLDIGITSVGWATLLLDSQDEPVRILDLNSRIFDKAEVPKTGASLAAPPYGSRCETSSAEAEIQAPSCSSVHFASSYSR